MSIINKVNIRGVEYTIKDTENTLDIQHGSGIFGMAMAHDGRASHEDEYQAVKYQVFARKRTDQDFDKLSSTTGAILMNAKVILDGSVTSTMQAKTGNFTNSCRINFTAANLGVPAPKQASGIILTTVICGALPSQRYLTNNGNVISSTNIGSNVSAEETYQQKVFAGFNTTTFFFLVPTQFVIDGTTTYLEQTKDAAIAYLQQHPVTIYYQTATLDTDQFVYVAIPAQTNQNTETVQETITELQSVIERPEYTSFFHKCVCIGDSLTRGYFSDYASGEHNRDFGYPFALARMTGMKVWNFGASGSDPSEWLQMANTTLIDIDFSQFDVALVAFGQNNDKPNDEGTYTAAEYTEMYLDVLQKLKNANPNMVIFCLSNPGPRNVSSLIQDIVAAATDSGGDYNYSFVYYLDITTDAPYVNYRTDGTHLNPVGYLLLAQTIKDRMTQFIHNNLSDFTGLIIPRTSDAIILNQVE